MAKKLDNLNWAIDSATGETTHYLGLDYVTAHRLVRCTYLNDEEIITLPGSTATNRPFVLQLSCANTSAHTTFGGIIYGSPEASIAGGALVIVQDSANLISLSAATHPGFDVTQGVGPLISLYNRLGTTIYVSVNYLYFT